MDVFYSLIKHPCLIMPIIDHIILSENGYFYPKKERTFLTSRVIRNILTQAAKDKTGRFLLKRVAESLVIDSQAVHFSACFFKTENKPTCLDTDAKGWEESTVGYLVIIELEDYFFITKKHISPIDNKISQFAENLSYEILSTLFLDTTTTIERLALINTNITPNVIRSKSVEADSIQQSFSTYGSSGYVPSNMRLKNNDIKTTIGLNSSRVANIGKKVNIVQLLPWVVEVSSKIRNHRPSNSYLEAFAKPVAFESMRDSLVPNSISINTTKIHEDIDMGYLVSVNLQTSSGITKIVSIDKLLDRLKPVMNVSPNAHNSKKFTIESTVLNDAVLKVNAKTLTIESKKGANIILFLQMGLIVI
jgi:hypothetical protein